MAAKRKKRGKRPSKKAPQPSPDPTPQQAEAGAEQPKPKLGPPSIYSLELVTDLCARLAEGRSLRSVCSDKDMPSKKTVMRWLATNKEFKDLYTIAKEESADYYVEDILDIVDDGTNDFMEQETKDGGVRIVVDHENIQRSKLRVDARKWLASKLKPKKYGETSSLKLGGDPDNPTPVAVTIVRFGSDGKLSAPFVTPAPASAAAVP